MKVNLGTASNMSPTDSPGFRTHWRTLRKFLRSGLFVTYLFPVLISDCGPIGCTSSVFSTSKHTRLITFPRMQKLVLRNVWEYRMGLGLRIHVAEWAVWECECRLVNQRRLNERGRQGWGCFKFLSWTRHEKTNWEHKCNIRSKPTASEEKTKTYL